MPGKTSAFFFLLVVVFISQTGSAAFAQDDIKTYRSCSYCGMDRKAYGYSRMLIRFEDGTAAGLCSLHCTVLELDANRQRGVRAIFAADRDTRELIEADKAFWVMGGSKRGVMTHLPKWAFSTKAAAETFIASYGGRLVTWQETVAAAREDAAGEK